MVRDILPDKMFYPIIILLVNLFGDLYSIYNLSMMYRIYKKANAASVGKNLDAADSQQFKLKGQESSVKVNNPF